jgi:glycine cleavage system H protein
MSIPGDLRYTRTHEWIRVNGNEGVVGITDFAQSELGDIVFVEAPEPGTAVSAGSPMGNVESVKAVSEIMSPVTGTVTAANEALKDHYGQGWIVKVTLSAPGEVDALMDAEAYGRYVAEAGH